MPQFKKIIVCFVFSLSFLLRHIVCCVNYLFLKMLQMQWQVMLGEFTLKSYISVVFSVLLPQQVALK